MALAGPLDIHSSLEGLRSSGDDLLDRWNGATLVRSVPHDSSYIPFAASSVGTVGQPLLDVWVRDAAHQDLAREAVGPMFSPEPAGWRDLLNEDPVLAGLDARYPGLCALRYLDPFTALVRAISA
ncbi:MAG: hypothetical protein ACRDFS_07595, partial [Chloroflexota bacterium]